MTVKNIAYSYTFDSCTYHLLELSSVMHVVFCFISFFFQLYQNWFQSVIMVIFVTVLSHSILLIS